MRRLIYPDFVGGRGAVGLLVLRLVVGAAFIVHGWPKIQNPFGWMNGKPIFPETPGILQACSAVAEFGGGIALILGLLTPLAALGIFGSMSGAMMMVHIPNHHPFVASGRESSYEDVVVYMAVMVLLILIGPGKLSVDAFLFCRKCGSANASAPS
jgi:putative oxidoreductase